MKERAFDEGVGRCTAGEKETNQQDKTFQVKNRDEVTSDNDIKVGIAHLLTFTLEIRRIDPLFNMGPYLGLVLIFSDC